MLLLQGKKLQEKGFVEISTVKVKVKGNGLGDRLINLSTSAPSNYQMNKCHLL